MKSAFTMIELIFVIVILGILAAVAIPKLAATRDDAMAVTAGSNIKQAIQDIAGFYLAKKEFSNNFSEMTNVILPVMFKGESCANFEYSSGSEVILRLNHDQSCNHVYSVGNLSSLRDIAIAGGIIIVE